MLLDGILLLVVVVPIVLVVVLRRRKDPAKTAGRVLGEIAGVFGIVFGLLLLFAALFLLFRGETTGFNIGLLAASLVLVFGGFAATRWAERRPKPEGGQS